jgi:hypothetical protein
MKSTTPPQNNDPALAALVLLALALEALARALRPLLAHGIALVLTAAGWRPRRRAASVPVVALPPARVQPAAANPLEALPVRELRQLARQAGHRALARSGRRADLLLALAA